jgi:hypothetical protein
MMPSLTSMLPPDLACIAILRRARADMRTLQQQQQRPDTASTQPWTLFHALLVR